MSAVLLLKLFLVPLLILGVTLAGRRWGPAVAGWLSAFPIVAGPILLTLALEQGAQFAAHAAHGTLLAVLAIMVFTLGYVWASARFQVPGSMACALAVYGVALAALQAVELDILACFALVIAALLLTPLLFAPPVAAAAPAKAGPGDLPWRMLAAAMLVLFVTYSASRLGARLSGFLAMFPVMSTVLVGFSHHRSGRAFAVALLRGMIYGYFAFATFCVLVSLLLQRQSIAFAFSVALACALVVQLLVKVLLALRQRNAAAAAPAMGK
ncbi:hypothetical protein [Massilia glaciei]|uniref:Uncharacterized protein n=1 Tax=Massilia glaciei TaxID=1524097 RepID=A0A2U2HNT6_9BURK|nr:hypothetical protein [Massilia glaciei]PWF49170.1 hypothetical protein C7C56_007990 [Massilia glaciei]